MNPTMVKKSNLQPTCRYLLTYHCPKTIRNIPSIAATLKNQGFLPFSDNCHAIPARIACHRKSIAR
jgi:hypothetical protein